MKALRLNALAVACIALGLIVPTAESATPSGWRTEQDIWWNTPMLVKNAVVSFFGLRTAPGVGLPGTKTAQSIVDLLLILDKASDRQTVNVLADLSTYDLGTAGSEVYDCLIVRKGSKMVAALRSRDSDTSDDCTKILGAGHPSCIATRGAEARRQRITDLVARVKSNQPCQIEQ
jgi:hypothetical protein